MLRFLGLLFFFFSTGLFAQELPPIQNYAPSDYRSENQNWAISQSDDKTIFVANQKYLLEYNGAEWIKYPSPNETVIRSVKVIGNRIFTGCYMEFGYWERNEFGMLVYNSISDRLNIDFIPDEEFWNILDVEEYIVFQSKNRIYIYNTTDNSVYTIDSGNTLPKIFNVDQSLYFQRLNEGIFRIQGGKDVLVIDESSVLDDEVVGVFKKENALVILTRHNGFFTYSNGDLEKWEVSSDDLLSQVSVYSSIQLKDGNYVLGTISNGLFLLDSQGNLMNHINQGNGLRNNTILSLFEDSDNNVWLGLDNGISYINLKSPFRVYHDNKGLVGSVYDALVKDGFLYLGTNQGLFFKRLDSTSEFRLITGTQGQVWSLNLIKDTIFCAHHSGTFIIKEGIATKIADVPGTWKISDLDERPNLLLQGNYDGLYVLEQSEDSWKLRNKLLGFDHSSRYFQQLGQSVFVNHEYKGVFNVEVDNNFETARNVEVDSLIKGSNSSLIKYQDELLYAYRKGIFRYDRNLQSFSKDSVLSQIFSEDEFVSGKLMVDDKDGYLWVFSDSHINYVTRGNLTNRPKIEKIPLSQNERSGIVGYESIIGLDDAKSYLIGSSSGYITVNIDRFKVQDFSVGIGRILRAGKNVDEREEKEVRLSENGEFADNENNFKISFHASVYDRFLKPQYQYQLEGMYPDWSEWSEVANTSFENLPPGDYIFNVRSKVGDKISRNVATYSFSIARPWYATNLMIAVYVLGILLSSIIIHNAYKRYYSKKQEKIVEQNERKIALAQAENEKEIIRIKNEQLREENKSKSNELAASTMSIIRKNELLAKIKEQLTAYVKDKEAVKPIINTIDSSLNQRDDWEMFKEAFNNADRKFLKKLKKAHPNLSPNDIRLCAYLRLNLSSKEIAPLLNISARSVEIKRYRLRKKMNLSHDDNLVKYILKL